MESKSQHVVPRGGRWGVRRTGSDKLTRTFDTQREAVEAAREIARNHGTELYIHGLDGMIRERLSYAKDRQSAES